MATVYKTPGVYIEEIPKFPPSVAQVETAIPAFIGYTQKADKIGVNDLLNKPTRISSFVEFELYYGEGPSPLINSIVVDDNNNFKSASVENKYFLYDSLRMFFDNGGGDCYIVAVDTYKSDFSVDDTKLKSGIDALLKVDEPTILLFPDAAVLDINKLTSIQRKAIDHCALPERMDRVTICDLNKDDALGTNFRSKIGMEFLSYGIAYTPWLKVSLPKKVTYPDVKDKITKGSLSPTVKDLAANIPNNADLLTLIQNTDDAYRDKQLVSTKVDSIFPGKSVKDAVGEKIGAYEINRDIASIEGLFDSIYKISTAVNELLTSSDAAKKLKYGPNVTSATAAVNSSLKPNIAKIITLETELKTKLAALTPAETLTVKVSAANFTDGLWGAGFVVAEQGKNLNLISGANKGALLDAAFAQIKTLSDNFYNAFIKAFINDISLTATKLEEGLVISFPVYKNIIRGVKDAGSFMPPSGAIAGIYAKTDRTRGVWKAPANVSLANVIEPSESFTKSQLDDLNIDVTAGKSINAIRSFFGKGTLVYGARTLAGNDNEWRYVPVRRLFIMIEESVKKATEQFVFEPNDANTWVKVQAMIENFLHVLWRQGALQGAKPEHAFYVSVGLNKTMNAIDILEGRLIVEVGLAAVRPAEFIILRFSHKLAES
jgi:uncharacterized protein